MMFGTQYDNSPPKPSPADLWKILPQKAREDWLYQNGYRHRWAHIRKFWDLPSYVQNKWEAHVEEERRRKEAA